MSGLRQDQQQQLVDEAMDAKIMRRMVDRMRIGYRDEGYFDKDVRRLLALCDWLTVNTDIPSRIVAMSERIKELERLALGSCDSADIAVKIGREANERIERLEAAEVALRRELWLRHGHSGPALYGDDGEMQCHLCMRDFKRDLVETICAKLFENDMTSAALAPAPERAKETE